MEDYRDVRVDKRERIKKKEKKGAAVRIFGVERRDGGGDETKRPEERTQVSDRVPHVAGRKSAAKSYSSKRQGQH